MGLRVLITNIELWPPSGTVLYVRDLALELRRQEHLPAVFSALGGAIAEELGAAGIPVTDRPDRLPWAPDIIHAHHHAPTMLALRAWPTTPALYVCHDHSAAHDRAPLEPQIRRYFGVSQVCLDRLLRDGAPGERSGLLLNFVDTARFQPREPLPPRPRRALVFSNYADAGSHLPVVTEACRRAGLELDVIGLRAGTLALRPEAVLGQYDIVFAKARAALEAMAVGAAVVLCDFAGAGPLVTAAAFDRLRPLNFGFAALDRPLEAEVLAREIAQYDPVDAERVRDRVRSEASLVAAVTRLVTIYDAVVAEGRAAEPRSFTPASRISRRLPLRASSYLRLRRAWLSVPRDSRSRLKRLPGVERVRRGLRRLLDESG
jgi:hypothetical protein